MTAIIAKLKSIATDLYSTVPLALGIAIGYFGEPIIKAVLVAVGAVIKFI